MKACLVGGLYPNLVRVDPGRSRSKFWAFPDHGAVKLHPSSVNAAERGAASWDHRWCVYFDKVRTPGGLFVYDTSEVAPLAVLLFGAGDVLVHGDGRLLRRAPDGAAERGSPTETAAARERLRSARGALAELAARAAARARARRQPRARSICARRSPRSRITSTCCRTRPPRRATTTRRRRAAAAAASGRGRRRRARARTRSRSSRGSSTRTAARTAWRGSRACSRWARGARGDRPIRRWVDESADFELVKDGGAWVVRRASGGGGGGGGGGARDEGDPQFGVEPWCAFAANE